MWLGEPPGCPSEARALPRTPFHKVGSVALFDLWPQTKFILGPEKLDLVEVGEGVFSGNVCAKVQAELGEGKRRAWCSAVPVGPVHSVTVTRAGGTHRS